MDLVGGWNLAVDPVPAGHGDMDLGWVDVAEIVEVEGRVMGQDAAGSPRPQRSLHQLILRRAGNRIEAIETLCDALERPSTLHLNKAPLVDPEVASVLGGHEPVLIEGVLKQDVMNSARHAHIVVQNAIVCAIAEPLPRTLNRP